MNQLDAFLCTLPQSTNGWHCPWFQTILALGLNGALWGLVAFFVEDSWLGLVAFVIGICAAVYTTHHRFRKGPNVC